MSDPSLEEALKTLSEAHGPAQLARAFEQLQGTVRTRRRRAAQAVGVLARTITEACRLRDAMRADGATLEQLNEAMEKTVRLVWPRRRPHHYICETCGDYGLDMRTCDGDERPTCGRTKPHLAHEYGRPCDCPAGARHREPERRAEDFTQAGKVTRKPTRWGR